METMTRRQELLVLKHDGRGLTEAEERELGRLDMAQRYGPAWKVCNFESGTLMERISRMIEMYADDFPDGYRIFVKPHGEIEMRGL